MQINVFLGKAGEFIDRGDNTYGGKYVINPSGGLISKGHPLGATGMYFVHTFFSKNVNSIDGITTIALKQQCCRL